MPAIALRPYRAADLPDLLATWEAAARRAYPFCDEAFFARERARIPTDHLPHAATTVCEVGGSVVGFLAMVDLEVGGLFVHPDHQGKGLGRALMQRAEQHAEGEELRLEVFTDNRQGRGFYARLGWQDTGRRTTHPETGHELMELRWRTTSA